MKKLFMTMLTVLACGAAYALPVGNPSDASLLCDGLVLEGHCSDPCDPCVSWCEAFSLRMGFYGDYVFNRHLEVDKSRISNDIENTEIYTNAGMITGNFYDRFDIFVTLGATNIFIDTNSKAFGLGGSGRFEIETETDFSWSIGARGTIWECGCTALGAEAQYFRTKPHVTRLTQNSTTSVYPSSDVKARYHEWQVGIGISHRINMLVPYVAVKWSHGNLDFNDETISGFLIQTAPASARLYDLKTKNGWSGAIGVSLIDCEKASLTFEGRFGGENAVHVNGQIRF